MEIKLSDHAWERSILWNIQYDEIVFIVEHAEQLRRTGALFRQFRSKDIPTATPANADIRRLVGTTVILCSCGEYVITLYRNERAFHEDRKKSKYCNRRHQGVCECCLRHFPRTLDETLEGFRIH